MNRCSYALCKRVIVPEAVVSELNHSGAPSPVKDWISRLPDWIEVKSAPARSDSQLVSLGPGEREAILLAQEERADLLLIDERQGRLEARRRGLATTGTLGVLLAGAKRDLVNAESAFLRLVSENHLSVFT